jgi:hypothetical protein
MGREYERRRPHEAFALYRVWADRKVRSVFTEYHVELFNSSYLGDEAETERWREEQRALIEIERFASEAGGPLHSPTPAFEGRSASELGVHPSDQHANAEGHRIAAEALLPWLESRLP